LDIHKLGDYSRIGEESLNRVMRLVELGGQQKLKIVLVICILVFWVCYEGIEKRERAFQKRRRFL